MTRPKIKPGSMTRPIKFRAWADGKMHKVRAISFTEQGNVHRIMDEDGVQRWPTALLQYTGFRDRRRREVYEGDVVAINGNARTVVEWQDYRWHPQLPKKTLYEVVGNVLENPELLRTNQQGV